MLDNSSLMKIRKVILLLTDPFIYVSIVSFMISLDWDDNLIFMASKKAYIIISKESGNMLQSFPHDKLSMP
jgi:hypothetical protein